jgi:AP-1 complex subunit gamma-1
VGTLIRILKSITKAGYTPEYDVGNISDPFLQIKILKLLRILGTDSAPVSERLNIVLASIVNTTDTVRNVGSSILYECVTTIMNIKSDGDLRAIAVNTLGKFLSNKDNNIRFNL